MSSADPVSPSSRSSSTSRLAEPEPPPKKSCLGCAFKGGLGCLAFLLGGLLVTWLLADRLSNGVARRFVEGSFDDSYEGSLEIGQVHLGFTDFAARQSIEGIRLLDPDGKEVLHADVELPPLGDFLSLWGKRSSSDDIELGMIRVALSGNIVVDDDGITNLDRTLEGRDSGGSVADVNLKGPDAKDVDPFDLLSRLSMECALDVSKLSYSDARTRDLGGEVVVRRLTARAVGRAGGAWRFNLDGDVVAPGAEGEEGKLFAEFLAPEPTWGRAEWPLGVVRGQGSAKELRTAILDGLTGQNGRISETIGDTVDIEFQLVEATPESGRIELLSHSAKQDLVFEGQFKEGRLSIDGTEGFAWRVVPPKAWIDEILRDVVPKEQGRVELGTLAPGERLTVALDRLEIPIADQDEMSTSGFSALRSARHTRFSGRVELPVGFVAHLPSGTFEVTGQGGVSFAAFEQAEDGVPQAALRLDVKDRESPSPDASLSVEIEGRDLWRKLLDPEGEEGEDVVEAEAQVKLEVFRTASFQRFVPRGSDGAEGEDLAAWLGESGVLELRVPSLMSDERVVRGGWSSDVLQADVDVRQAADALLTAAGDEEPAVRVRFLGPQLERRLQQALPSGERVTLPGAFAPEGGAVFEVQELRLAKLEAGETPKEAPLEAPAEAAIEADTSGLDLAGSHLTGVFSLPSLHVRAREASAGDAALEDLRFEFRLAEAGPLRLDLTSKVTGGSEDSLLEARALGRQPWSSLAEAQTAEGEAGGALQTATFDLNLDARSVPTVLLDGLSQGEGLLVDVLGEAIDVEVRAANFGMNAGRLEADFQSGLGEVKWQGRMQEGQLISEGEDVLDASVALTPLFSSRIVGNLVPLLVNVSKEDDVSPVTLDVSNCTLPLDGDLSKLSGEVKLDLGEVYYAVLPQFGEWLGDMTRTKSTEVIPLSFKIQNGVVLYEQLPIKIEGEIYGFDGSFNLTTRKLALTTSMPLTHLGSSISKELARAREDYDLDPNLAVPFEIGGTLTRPKIGIASGFLEGLVGDLLETGLERELKKGLEKLLGKD